MIWSHRRTQRLMWRRRRHRLRSGDDHRLDSPFCGHGLECELASKPKQVDDGRALFTRRIQRVKNDREIGQACRGGAHDPLVSSGHVGRPRRAQNNRIPFTVLRVQVFDRPHGVEEFSGTDLCVATDLLQFFRDAPPRLLL